MKKSQLSFLNRKRNVDVIKDMETDPLADWKNGFLLTPKRRSLSQNESSNFNNSTPAPLATLDEDDGECKENEHNDEEKIDYEASTSRKTPDTPRIRQRMRRSLSVPLVNKSRGSSTSDDGNKYTNTTCDSPPPPSGMCLNRIDSRRHVFERKRVFIKAVCYICYSNIRFGIEAVKCQLCKSVSHQHCSRRAPIPCIPWAPPPKATNGRLRLGDYCADGVVPKLPHLIIRCVQYLNTEKYSRGLYTNYDYSTEADFLLKLVQEKIPPELKGYGPQATAHCVIKFLSDIR
uniref:Phorbol-ester/DAG-type domain-containing protein n=1 Tax=Panagrolaimus superbus TaxID=310955 RepID=A0A914XYX3_9BILA